MLLIGGPVAVVVADLEKLKAIVVVDVVVAMLFIGSMLLQSHSCVAPVVVSHFALAAVAAAVAVVVVVVVVVVPVVVSHSLSELQWHCKRATSSINLMKSEEWL